MRAGEMLIDVFVGILIDQRTVQVQRTLQKYRIYVLQVRAIGPEPGWHLSNGRRRHHETDGKWLLQNLTNLFQKMKSGIAT